MPVFTIDQDKCEQDGLCVAVCPRGIIQMNIGESYPAITEGCDDSCLECGHCMAVCPHQALQLQKFTGVTPAPSSPSKLPTNEQLIQLIRGRRSIRAYKKNPVEREIIREIIDLARYAPNAKNSQMLHWLVIDNEDEISTLREHTLDWIKNSLSQNPSNENTQVLERIIQAHEQGDDFLLRNAPGLILLHAPKEYPFGLVDGVIATATFELIASSKSIGTCWAGFFMSAAKSWAPLRDALKLPDGHRLTTALMVGYPKFRYSSLPERNKPEVTWR